LNALAEVVKNHVFLNKVTPCETQKCDPDHSRNARKVKTCYKNLIHGAAIHKSDIQLRPRISFIHVDLKQFAPGRTPPDTPIHGQQEQLHEMRGDDIRDHRDHHFNAHLVEPLVVVVLVVHTDIRTSVAENVVYQR
jgi:hypothetical protein